MGDRMRRLTTKLAEYRYVLLAAMAGLLLMLWPSGGRAETTPLSSEEEQRIAELLTQIEGVGQAQVLLSDKGVVVVCSGAESSSVRLRITQAVRCYTGLSAADVEIFLTDQNRREES